MNNNAKNISNKTTIKTLYISLLFNILLSIIKWIAGIFGNSNALIADAVESTADTISSVILAFTIKFAYVPADSNHPYGHGRIETFITFIIGTVLMCSASIIAYKSFVSLLSPRSLPSYWTLIVLLLIILWKEFCYQYMVRKSKQTNSSALKAEAMHHRSDAITSLTAFIGISLSYILGAGFENMDDYAALIAAAWIFYNGFKIIYEVLKELMDENDNVELINKIRAKSILVPGILDTEKCYLRKYGSNYHVNLHLLVDANITVKEGHDLAHQARAFLVSEIPELEDVLIHIEPEGNH